MYARLRHDAATVEKPPKALGRVERSVLRFLMWIAAAVVGRRLGRALGRRRA
jgi:hypothetical protein